jgi:hypothetical protein
MSQQQPHGWAPTRTGSLLHYFGLPYRHKGYRPDGTPLALCHNALQVAPDCELVQEIKQCPHTVTCTSCEKYLMRAPTALLNGQPAPTKKKATGSFTKDARVRVMRGAYAGGTGTIERASAEAVGFHWVWISVFQTSLSTFKTKEKTVRALLSEGQLELIEK